MQTPTEWRLECYREAAGFSPVEDFLDGIDVKTRARFDHWLMLYLPFLFITITRIGHVGYILHVLHMLHMFIGVFSCYLLRG